MVELLNVNEHLLIREYRINIWQKKYKSLEINANFRQKKVFFVISAFDRKGHIGH